MTNFRVANTEIAPSDFGDGYLVRHLIETVDDQRAVIGPPEWTPWVFISNERGAWMAQYFATHDPLQNERATVQ